jgi:hypothetical protein
VIDTAVTVFWALVVAWAAVSLAALLLGKHHPPR